MSNDDKLNQLKWAITDSISDLVDEQAKKHGVDADDLFNAVASDLGFRAAISGAFERKPEP
jgi:hypothetical protein